MSCFETYVVKLLKLEETHPPTNLGFLSTKSSPKIVHKSYHMHGAHYVTKITPLLPTTGACRPSARVPVAHHQRVVPSLIKAFNLFERDARSFQSRAIDDDHSRYGQVHLLTLKLLLGNQAGPTRTPSPPGHAGSWPCTYPDTMMTRSCKTPRGRSLDHPLSLARGNLPADPSPVAGS